MVNDLDFEQLAAPNDVPRHLDVSLGWRRIPAWVVVDDGDCRRSRDQCAPEYDSRVHKDRIHRTDGDKFVAFQALAGVEHQDGEAFAIGSVIRMGGDVHPPVVGDLLRFLADLHMLRHRAVSQGDDLVLLRVEVMHRRPRILLGCAHMLLYSFDTPLVVCEYVRHQA